MPSVTVFVKVPSGEPMASTCLSGRRLSESPMRATAGTGGSTFRTATSLLASAPIRCGGQLLAVLENDEKLDPAFDDVLVGDHVPIFVENESAPGSVGNRLRPHPLDLLR